MTKRKGLVFTCILLVWTVGMPLAWGQGKTTVQLDSIGDAGMQHIAEKNASAVITEFNRAEALGRRPDLSSLPVTERGRRDIRSHWNNARFFCNRTTLARSLVRLDDGIYEIREVPLIMEDGTHRSSILTVNAEGEVIGFRYNNEPATGTITVFTEPSKALVESPLENTSQTAPVQFEDVPGGQHEFTIRKEAYQSLDTTLAVLPYQTRKDTIRLTPTFGYLRVEANPKTIEIDGVEYSPSEQGHIRVEAGKHVVTLTRQYHQTYDTTLTVAPGQTEVVSTELQRKRTPFRVFSDPSGAAVVIDGDTVGTTPFLTTREAGRAYALRLDAERYVPSERMNIFVEADTVVEREVTLSPVEIQAKGDEVSIDNVRADRSEGLVTITYDLVGEPDETYEVALSVSGRGGDLTETDSEAVRGAIGENIAPGPDKKIYWRKALPEGAALQLTQGSPSVATSLTVGYFGTDFQLEGNEHDSPYDFDRSLKTIMFTGRTGSFSVGYDNFSSTQGTNWALNISSTGGGNVHIFRPYGKHILLLYMPVRVRGNYIYTDPSFDVGEEEGGQNILNVGIGTGFGGRLRIGRLPKIRKHSILNDIMMEGSVVFTPSGYFNIDTSDPKRVQLSRTRDIDVELRIENLIDTGVGRGLGITLGFTHRILSRTTEQPRDLGEILQSAFESGNLERISTQRLFRIGINWQ